jgi:hypothetical protein
MHWSLRDGSKQRVACPPGGGIDAMNDSVRHKRLVEKHYVVFWSDVPNEMVAAQLIFEFEDHMMPAGAPRLGWWARVSCATDLRPWRN